METLEDTAGGYFFALPTGTKLFEYRIESVLGQGGFGITYLATDVLLDEAVAIKEYFPNDSAFRTRDLSARAKSPQDRESFASGLEAFLGEARIIARFRHRNIMQVRRFFEAHGTGYIVLQFETGHSFEDIMAEGPLPEHEIIPILSGILDGLEAVHERAILHRDIKPRNVIIRTDGTPVLIDFGAARDFSARDSQTVTKMASPGYSPPEQYGVGSQQGPWSDFYALGAMMYRAVTGKVPIDSLRRLRNDPLVPTAQAAAGRYSKVLLRTIDHMTRIDERERPASVADIKAALLPLSPLFAPRFPDAPKRRDTTKSVAEPKRVPEPEVAVRRDKAAAAPAKKRLRLGLGLGVLALLAIAGGSYVFTRGPASDAAKEKAAKDADSETLVLSEQAKRATAEAAQKREADAARAAAVAKAEADAKNDFTPGRFFRDCPTCPEMAVLPAGRFQMGSDDGFPNEAPPHDVTIPAAFAMSRDPITFAEWDACVAAGGCEAKAADQGWGRDTRPAINVTFADAQAFVGWLSQTTGHAYRVPSEAEWEYAARAGTATTYWWGADAGQGHALCADCLTPRPTTTQPVATYAPNAFGLYDTAGNVAQWVDDCWRETYATPVAKTDDCKQHVTRGGSFRSDARYIRPSARVRYTGTTRSPAIGFRVARDGPAR